MKKSIVFLLLLFGPFLDAQYAALPSNANPSELNQNLPNQKNWRIHIDWMGQLYPSYVLGVAGNSFESSKRGGAPDYVGDVFGMVGAIFENPPLNAQIVVSIEATKYSGKAQETYTVNKKFRTLAIFPKIPWNYDLLRANDQATPLDFTVQVSINGKSTTQTATANLRAVDDCPLWSRDYKGDSVNLNWMFAHYVNEGSPLVKDLLLEVQSKTKIKEFVGQQLGEEMALYQLYAIWQVIRQKGYKYSSITTNGQNIDANGRIISQRVRFFEDVCRERQYNCIDMTAYLASVLESIDISTAITLIPGHAFLAVYSNSDKTSAYYLESTLIGASPIALNSEMLASEDVKSLCKSLYSKFALRKSIRDPEIDHFVYTLLQGTNNYTSSQAGGSAVTCIDISKVRPLVKPGYRGGRHIITPPPPSPDSPLPSTSFKFIYKGKSSVPFENNAPEFFSTTPPKNGHCYKVHVDFFTRETDAKKYESIKKFGKQTVEWVPQKEHYRLLIAELSEFKAAIKLAMILRKQGYPYSSVVHYYNGNRLEIKVPSR